MVPHSQSKDSCWRCGESCGRPFCEKCQALQPIPEGLSHFDVLGIDPSLLIDEHGLQERFYALSRRLHPDRYAASSGPEALHALRWTTALNRAYQMLREPLERSRYFLALFGETLETDGKKVPLALAEKYFELQELEANQGSGALKTFQEDLKTKLAESQSQWTAIARSWTADPGSKEVLKRLAVNLDERRFLESMMRDLRSRIEMAS